MIKSNKFFVLFLFLNFCIDLFSADLDWRNTLRSGYNASKDRGLLCGQRGLYKHLPLKMIAYETKVNNRSRYVRKIRQEVQSARCLSNDSVLRKSFIAKKHGVDEGNVMYALYCDDRGKIVTHHVENEPWQRFPGDLKRRYTVQAQELNMFMFELRNSILNGLKK